MLDVVVIGAGASGLFCAQLLGKAGRSVQVLDHSNKAGKKILMSGGGRCNFTNTGVTYDNFVGSNPAFVRSALARFRPDDFLAYVYKHNIAFHEKAYGELFCVNSARDILQMLLDECQVGGVNITLNTTVQSVNHTGEYFELQLMNKDNSPQCIQCHKLVVATGGLSIPTMGASGFGYVLARQFGHTIVPTVPSLVPFTFSDHIKALAVHLAGISHDVVMFNDKISFALPLLFTHRGLSGPASLQLSNYWALGEPLSVDLLPNVDAKALLLKHKQTQPKQTLRAVFAPFFAKKLLLALEELLWQSDKHTPLAEIKDAHLITLGQTLNAWQLKPSGTEGYRVAEVTRGGVAVDEVSSKTMASKKQAGLYFIGEVLDVSGWLGGYNFQWAWASAAACASAISACA